MRIVVPVRAENQTRLSSLPNAADNGFLSNRVQRYKQRTKYFCVVTKIFCLYAHFLLFVLVSSIQPWQKTPRVGAAQLRDSPENCVRAAFAKSGMKREMGHQMGRHIIHTVAATEVDTRQRIHNLAL